MQQLDAFAPLPYHGRAPHNGTDTSILAAASVDNCTATMRGRLLTLIGSGKSTCDELEARTGWRHQTVSARIRELVLLGSIVDTGERAKTRSGRSARLYAAV